MAPETHSVRALSTFSFASSVLIGTSDEQLSLLFHEKTPIPNFFLKDFEGLDHPNILAVSGKFPEESGPILLFLFLYVPITRVLYVEATSLFKLYCAKYWELLLPSPFSGWINDRADS